MYKKLNDLFDINSKDFLSISKEIKNKMINLTDFGKESSDNLGGN